MAYTKLSTPPAIGDITPNTGAFTSVAVGNSGQFQINSSGIVTSGTWNGSILVGTYGGTGINNGSLTINLGSGAFGKYMASDSSGNATWATLSSAAVTSISGTTNQINASASTGSVTLSLSSTIVTPGTVSVNGALQSFSTTTCNATTAYNVVVQGTQTASTGSTFFQSGVLIQSVFSQPNNGFITAGITAIPRFIAASTKSISLSAAYYASVNSSGNIGTLTNLAHFYSDGFVAVGGTATNVYGFYGADPATGTNAMAAYFANISVGYSTVDLKGTNNAVFSGNMSVGSSSVTSLFNVGSANQFQINSSGQVISGTWHGSVVELAYGGTNANLTASNGGIFYSTATAGAILAGTATAGQILRSGSSSAPSWSTATYPATASSAGTILRADGTNWVATTATYPTTTTINQILYSSSANTIAGITASANGVLISSATNVPSFLAAGTTGQYLAATTGSPPSWATLSSAAVTSIAGTANQISASASTGAVTLSFPNGISIGSYQSTSPPTGGLIAPGQIGIGISSVDTVSLVTTVNTGLRRVFYVGGTSTVTSSFDTYGAYCSFATWAPSAGNTNYILDFVGTGRFVAPAASTLSGIIGCFYASPTTSGNLGTITNLYGFIYDGGSAAGGTVTNSYGGYFATPTGGTNKHALHAHNLSVGSSYVTTAVPPTDGLIVQGRTGIGTTGPLNQLDVAGALAGGGYAGTATAPANTCMFSGGFIAGSGSAGGPTYTFFSDNTSGMYYTSSAVNFSTASTQRAKIDSGGITITNSGLLYTDTGTSGGGTLHHALRSTGSVFRFAVGLQNTESSGNAGSNYNIFSYADNGAFLGNPLTIIRSSGTVGINTGSSANTSSIFNSTSTLAYNHLLNGTQTGVDGATNSAAIYVNPSLIPTNGSTISAGIYDVPVLAAPSGKTITVAAGQYISVDTGSNVGVIGSLIPLYIGLGNLTVNGTIQSAYGIYVSQPLASATGNYYAGSFQGGMVFHRTATATDYTVKTSDYFVGVTSTAAARTITLPSTAPDAGWTVIVKDESNAAATNNITIARNGRNINGAAANLTINTNAGVFRIYSDGSNYWTW